MPHASEKSSRLNCRIIATDDLGALSRQDHSGPAVHLYRLPWGRADSDAANSRSSVQLLLSHAAGLDPDAVACFLTTAPDAARLLCDLPHGLHFQLWIAVKISLDDPDDGNDLPNRHAALIVLSRYRGSLRHTKTRVAYTYCPGCGKTTKDYGGKKHTYHEYGTLLSDVWRDFDFDPCRDISPIIDRLQDLFGIPPHRDLIVHDLISCGALMPAARGPAVRRPIGRKPPTSVAASVRLINGDCLAALRAMPSESVEYCFADPPYNIKKKYDRWDDGLDIQEYFRWCDQWIDELCRVVRTGCSVTLINIPLWCVRHFEHLSRTSQGMQFQHWIAWDGLSLPVRLIMPAHYGILTFSKGEPRSLPGLQASPGEIWMGENVLRPHPETYCLRASCLSAHRLSRTKACRPVTDLWHDIHRLKHNSKRVDHPCQLPPALMRRLMALYTTKGETVLDPFNGAGTTTLVAAQMHRSAIGIELSEDYHRLAEQRHGDLQSGIDPFGRTDEIPKAKNSRVERLPRRSYLVPKKVLQLEVRRIAQALGRLPTREEVTGMSKHPIAYFDEYFVSWGEVCAAARNGGMSEWPKPSADPQPALFDSVGR